MRTVLLSAANHLLPALAVLVPIGSVLYHAAAFIQPTPSEMIAFMAGAFAAAVFSVTVSALKSSTTSFTEVRHA